MNAATKALREHVWAQVVSAEIMLAWDELREPEKAFFRTQIKDGLAKIVEIDAGRIVAWHYDEPPPERLQCPT